MCGYVDWLCASPCSFVGTDFSLALSCRVTEGLLYCVANHYWDKFIALCTYVWSIFPPSLDLSNCVCLTFQLWLTGDPTGTWPAARCRRKSVILNWGSRWGNTELLCKCHRCADHFENDLSPWQHGCRDLASKKPSGVSSVILGILYYSQKKFVCFKGQGYRKKL